MGIRDGTSLGPKSASVRVLDIPFKIRAISRGSKVSAISIARLVKSDHSLDESTCSLAADTHANPSSSEDMTEGFFMFAKSLDDDQALVLVVCAKGLTENAGFRNDEVDGMLGFDCSRLMGFLHDFDICNLQGSDDE